MAWQSKVMISKNEITIQVPSDVELAVAGDVECIVTGDKDLLVLKRFRGIEI
jgi:predicted nucleic acid-binding protein